MILKDLKLQNFLVFYGNQSFEFPSEGNRNLVLILANNNTGKTCLIRALRFLFYGDLPRSADGKHMEAADLVNDRAFHELESGKSIEALVEVTIEVEDEEYVYRRRIQTSRTAGGERTRATTFLERNSPSEPHKFLRDQNNAFQNGITRMVPKGLFDAFYFQGEPMDGKLLEGVGTIRTALSSFMHLEKWQEARAALLEVKRTLDNQIRNLSSKHREYDSLIQTIQGFEAQLLRRTEELAEARKKLEVMEAELAEADKAITNLADTTEYDSKVRKRSALDKEVFQLKIRVDRLNEDIFRAVGRTRGLPYMIGAIPKARNVLKTLVENNVLPAELSRGFVERVLSETECICGKPHDGSSREHWHKYLERALYADVNDKLMQVLNLLEPNNEQGYTRLAQSYLNSLKILVEDLSVAREELAAKRSELEALEAEISDDPTSKIRDRINEALKRQISVRQQVSTARDEIKGLENSINNREMLLNGKRREAASAKPRGKAGADIDTFQKASDRATRLARFIDDFEGKLKGTFYGKLQKHLEETYNQHASDGSKAEVDNASLLPSIVSREGRTVVATGGGQKSLLALSYVVALSRLRKEIHQMMRELDVFLGRVDDQSFVIDSPFSAVDPNYVRSMSSFLVDSARQTIVLMARQQWDQAAIHLEPHAAKIYAMRLHTDVKSLKNLKPEDFDFKTRTGTHRLIADVGEIQNRYTEILEVH